MAVRAIAIPVFLNQRNKGVGASLKSDSRTPPPPSRVGTRSVAALLAAAPAAFTACT